MEELFQQIKLNKVKRKLVPIANDNGLLIEEYVKDNDKNDNNVKTQGLKINEKVKSYKITNNYTQSNAPLGQIKSVLLSLADEEQIQQQAVCEVFDTRLYNKGLPRLNSAIDSRMGPATFNERCVTCNGSIADGSCGGHNAYTKLIRRVYLPQYITEIFELIQCICWRCSRILIDTNSPAYQSILKIKNAQRRRQKLVKLCSSVQWCGGQPPPGFIYPDEEKQENSNNEIIKGGKKNSKLSKFDAEKYIHNRSQGCGALQLSYVHCRKDWLTIRCFSRIPVNEKKNIGRKSKKIGIETKASNVSKRGRKSRKSNESGDENDEEIADVESGEENGEENEEDDEELEEKENVEDEADEEQLDEEQVDDEKEGITDEENEEGEEEEEDDDEETDEEEHKIKEKQKPINEQEDDENDEDNEEEDDEDGDILALHLDDDDEDSDINDEDEILNKLHLPNMDDENEFMDDDIIYNENNNENNNNNNSNKSNNNNNNNNNNNKIIDPTQLGLEELSLVNFVSLSTFKRKKIPSKMLKNLPPLHVEQSFTPDHAYQIFKRIRESDYYILGFVHYSKPHFLCPRILLIPGNSSRIAAGSKTSDGKRARENSDFTKHINRIVQFNLEAKTYYNTILEKIKLGQSYHKEYRSMLIAIENVQISIGEYICRDDLGTVPTSGGHAKIQLKCITDLWISKHGKIRGYLNAKRVDYSARSVIISCPEIDVNELAVPIYICMKVTKPIVVNKYNIHFLQECVDRGPDRYPGAKFITKPNGQKIDLRYARGARKILQYGDKVERSLIKGDIVIFGRQPTLHRPSMMVHYVVPWSLLSFGLNLYATTPYNADFDGDEMNLHILQTEESNAEAEQLMAVQTQIVGVQDRAIMGAKQDSLIAAYIITAKNRFFDESSIFHHLCRIRYWQGWNHENPSVVLPIPAVMYQSINHDDIFANEQNENLSKNLSENNNSTWIKRWSGKQIFSIILPKTTYYQPDNNIDAYSIFNDSSLIIRFGELLCGRPTGDHIAATRGSLFQVLFHDASNIDNNGVDGSVVACQTMSDLNRNLNPFIFEDGFSVGCDDNIRTAETKRSIENIINHTLAELSKPENQDLGEYNINLVVDKAREQAGCMVLVQNENDGDNRDEILVKSKAKGTNVHRAQANACVGQVKAQGKRMPNSFVDRHLPHIKPNDPCPTAKGFVRHCLIEGLTPIEQFDTCKAGREGLTDTQCKIPDIGYMQRCMNKGMEDEMVRWDGTSRSLDDISSFSHGDGGFNPSHLETQSYSIIQYSKEKLYQDLYAFNRFTFLQNDFNNNNNNSNNNSSHYLFYNNNIFSTNSCISLSLELSQYFTHLQEISQKEYNDIMIDIVRMRKYKSMIDHVANVAAVTSNTGVIDTSKAKFDNSFKAPVHFQRLIERAKLQFLEERDQEIYQKNLLLQQYASSIVSPTTISPTIPTSNIRNSPRKKALLNSIESNTIDNQQKNQTTVALPLILLDPIKVYLQVQDLLKACATIQIAYTPMLAFTALVRWHLSIVNIVFKHQLTQLQLDWLCEQIKNRFRTSIINPGEMVGPVAAQSIGEPASQMTLNSFHSVSAGTNDTNMSIPRAQEIVRNSKSSAYPVMTAPILPQYQDRPECILHIKKQLEYLKLSYFLKRSNVVYEPSVLKCAEEFQQDQWLLNLYNAILLPEDYTNYCNYVIRFELDRDKCIRYNKNVDYFFQLLQDQLSGKCHIWMCSPNNCNTWIIRLRIRKVASNSSDYEKYRKRKFNNAKTVNSSTTSSLTQAQVNGYATVDRNINDVSIENVNNNQNPNNSNNNNQNSNNSVASNSTDIVDEKRIMTRIHSTLLTAQANGIEKLKNINIEYVLDWQMDSKTLELKQVVSRVFSVVGTNVQKLAIVPGIDFSKIKVKDIARVEECLDIDAARISIFREMKKVFLFNGSYCNDAHILTMSKFMSRDYTVKGITRRTVDEDDENSGFLKQISFEKIVGIIMNSALKGTPDNRRTVTSNIMLGCRPPIGTNLQVKYNLENIIEKYIGNMEGNNGNNRNIQESVQTLLEDVYKHNRFKLKSRLLGPISNIDDVKLLFLNQSKNSIDLVKAHKIINYFPSTTYQHQRYSEKLKSKISTKIIPNYDDIVYQPLDSSSSSLVSVDITMKDENNNNNTNNNMIMDPKPTIQKSKVVKRNYQNGNYQNSSYQTSSYSTSTINNTMNKPIILTEKPPKLYLPLKYVESNNSNNNSNYNNNQPLVNFNIVKNFIDQSWKIKPQQHFVQQQAQQTTQPLQHTPQSLLNMFLNPNI